MIIKSGLSEFVAMVCRPCTIYEETAQVKKNTAPMHMQNLTKYYLISHKNFLNM